MAVQPVLRDDNGVALADRCSELFTRRFTEVGTAGQTISLPVDVKEVLLHVEGSTVKARITGTVPGSEEINWTTDGLTLPAFPVVKAGGEPICTVAIPSGTADVSVMAWR